MFKNDLLPNNALKTKLSG